MKRVMLIGCCGSGKSTLARKIQAITKLPLYHLDTYFWKPEWKETPKDEWEDVVKTLAENESWIIDGNYGGTMSIRLNRADTLIYLDLPTWKCMIRVCKRIIKYKGEVRPDMPPGCKERWDIGFLHYVLTFNIRRRRSLHTLINKNKDKKTCIVIKSEMELESFLENLNQMHF